MTSGMSSVYTAQESSSLFSGLSHLPPGHHSPPTHTPRSLHDLIYPSALPPVTSSAISLHPSRLHTAPHPPGFDHTHLTTVPPLWSAIPPGLPSVAPRHPYTLATPYSYNGIYGGTSSDGLGPHLHSAHTHGYRHLPYPGGGPTLSTLLASPELSWLTLPYHQDIFRWVLKKSIQVMSQF